MSSGGGELQYVPVARLIAKHPNQVLSAAFKSLLYGWEREERANGKGDSELYM